MLVVIALVVLRLGPWRRDSFDAILEQLCNDTFCVSLVRLRLGAAGSRSDHSIENHDFALVFVLETRRFGLVLGLQLPFQPFKVLAAPPLISPSCSNVLRRMGGERLLADHSSQEYDL